MSYSKIILCSLMVWTFTTTGLSNSISESNRTMTQDFFDETISNHMILQNKTINVFGQLTILNGGFLEILDSIILLNPYQNGTSNITVSSGGTLNIIDSPISSNTSYAYNINLLNGSNCYFSGIKLCNCGYLCASAYDRTGLIIKSNNFTLANSFIYYEDAGIYVDTYASITIINTIFSPNSTLGGWGPVISDFQTTFSIENCIFNGKINNSNFNTAGYASFGLYGKISIINSTFNEADCGVDSAYISNCSFIGNRGDYLLEFGPDPSDVHNCTLINSNTTNGVGIRAIDNNGIVNITNTTISTNTTDIDIGRINAPTNIVTVNLINTTYSTYSINNIRSKINSYNYLTVNVLRQSNLAGMSYIPVQIYNSSNKLVYTANTDNNGSIQFIPLKYKELMKSTSTDFSPYKIVVLYNNISFSKDNIDMNKNENVEFILDDIPPALNITYPPQGLLTNSSLITVTGTTDNDVHVVLNGMGITNNNGVISQGWWLNEGNNTLDFKAMDTAGNIAEVIRNVTLKTIGPSIKITEPNDGNITNHNPIVVKGTTNGTRVEIDGTAVPLNLDGTFTFNYTFPHEGQYSIIATAWDIANNSAMARVRVDYDITPPTIVITFPANGTYTNTQSIKIRGQIQGASDAKLNGEALHFDSDGYFDQSINLVTGLNKITVWAEDVVGNVNSTSIEVILDTTNTLEITEPTNNLLTNISLVTIKGYTDSDATVTIGDKTVTNNKGNFTEIISLQEGLNKITVVSIDRAGNRVEKSISITLDTIPPEIMILSPTGNVVNEMNIEIQIQSEVGAIVKVNGNPVIGNGGIFIYDVTLEKGDNTFTITAQDPAGNLNSTMKVFNYIPPKPPTQTTKNDNGLLLPVIFLVIVAAIAIAAYMLLRKKRPPVVVVEG